MAVKCSIILLAFSPYRHHLWLWHCCHLTRDLVVTPVMCTALKKGGFMGLHQPPLALQGLLDLVCSSGRNYDRDTRPRLTA